MQLQIKHHLKVIRHQSWDRFKRTRIISTDHACT